MKLLPRVRLARWALAIVAPLSVGYAVHSLSQSSPPNITPVALSADPLYAQGSGQKPTLTLAISVEHPTVGAAYRGAYVPATAYQGYFDPLSCYTYDKASTTKHFARSSASDAATHSCAGAGFSGNFLNWAAASSIDIMRLGLTGGDRIEDSASSTILQRAVVPSNFYDDGSYFPRKELTNAVARQALPADFFASGDTNNVRISNCLNRIHIFSNGTAATKGGADACNDSSAVMGPILQRETNTNMPNGYTQCAGENATCSFTGTAEVVYGSGKKWHRRLVTNGIACNNSQWGEDPAPGSGKSCHYKPTTTALSTPMKIIGGEEALYVRVKACSTSGGTLTDSRASVCQRYPNGNYKPVGNMQKYSDRIRLAAFGYLMDNGDQRYGGVLRAPMTYVGPKTYDANGDPSVDLNPNREWNPDNGVFIANPRAATEGISGVMNYLNTFGRTGTPGTYKGNDPVSELYYESLRYLQGLAPTPQAVSGLTANDARRAGFPVYASWTDPFDGGSSDKNYACLRNSVLLIGDVNTHADRSIPGNSITSNSDFDRTSEVSLANNIPNFKDWTRVVGGFEAGQTIRYLDGRGDSQVTSNTTTIRNTGLSDLDDRSIGSGSKSSYYMAGMAYWAHTHDIRGRDWTETAKRRPGMRVTTYVVDVNENSANNDATARRRTHFFLAAKYGGFNDVAGTGNPYEPSNDARSWEKETDPGEAKTYFLVSDADKFLKSLDDIFFAAAKASNTISSPAASTNTLSTTDGYYYTASFNTERWSGDIKRNTIKVSDNGDVQVGDAASAVSAAARLDALTDAQTSGRKIVVGLESAASTGGSAALFTWSAIGNTLKAHLNKASPTATADNDGQNRLNFLRGHRSQEAVTFRQRNSRLGDIVNSAAAYSAVPTTRYNTTAYRTFYDNNKNRTKAVFVGANDGMLHAFNSTTMEELFAYIPSWMGPKLSQLTNTNYNSSGHTSYVDAPPAVAEAQVGSNWKTVLVSGTGGGGQGVFALDVTDPSDFAADKVLWEFTDQNDTDMGNVVSQPRIVKLRTSVPGAATATYKWFAAVASGVNNYVNDGTGRYSTTGKPALFLLDLSKPSGTDWSLGTNYFKVSLPISNVEASGTQEVNAAGTGTGVGKATGLVNFDFTNDQADAVEFFYMGDLHGQFWKLDMAKANLSSATETNWNLLKLTSYKNTDGTSPLPMYIARDSSNKVQPITMVPTIAYGPSNSYILAFGTGKYLEAKDNNVGSNTQTQSFYVLYDSGNAVSKDLEPDTDGTARFNGRARLKAGSITNSAISVGTFYWNRPRDSNATDKKAGWYIDYPKSGSLGGEKQIGAAALFGQTVRFTSLLPPSASTDACGGGSSYSYEANLASGLGTVTTMSSGAQGSPMFFYTNSSLSNSDSTGARVKTDQGVFVHPDATATSGVSVSETKTATSQVGRLSWRQLNNYRELKNKAWD